jgi:hypothetical protein
MAPGLIAGRRSGEDRVFTLDAKDPSRSFELALTGGVQKGGKPMAIVWPCQLSVEEYVAVGHAVDTPRPDCPTCSSAMGFWGFYERDLRLGEVVRLTVRRVRCRHCACSHALLPDFATQRRLDGVEVIGSAMEAMATGASDRKAAETADVPHTTVRSWRRRVQDHAEMLTAEFCAAAVAMGGLAPRLAERVLAALVAAVTAATTAAARRLGVSAGVWRTANRIIGGQLLTTNTDPPWSAR